jgi:hypothetical protein
MNKLATLALVALMLTGCGTQGLPTAGAPRRAAAAVTASADRSADEIQLYGAFIVGKVREARRLTNKDENGKPFVFQELVVDAKSARFEDGPHGKVVFRVITGNPIAKVGQTVETFINYPVISAKTNTFINKPGKPFWAHDLTIVD